MKNLLKVIALTTLIASTAHAAENTFSVGYKTNAGAGGSFMQNYDSFGVRLAIHQETVSLAVAKKLDNFVGWAGVEYYNDKYTTYETKTLCLPQRGCTDLDFSYDHQDKVYGVELGAGYYMDDVLLSVGYGSASKSFSVGLGYRW